jgi:hypothetical protein
LAAEQRDRRLCTVPWDIDSIPLDRRKHLEELVAQVQSIADRDASC